MTQRPYFSWSAYNLFGHSPEQYRKRYILGEAGPQTPAMAFGKAFAESRERGLKGDLSHVAMFLPNYPHREYEITATVKIEGKNVVLLGVLDGVDLKKHIIGDDKTGQKYTQAMADKLEQLTWYAFIYFLKKKIIPKLELNWIETERPLPYADPGLIRATGKVETFETTRTHKDFVILMSKIQKRWRGILNLCATEWNKVL